MKTAVFLDTVHILALANPRDAYHAQAIEASERHAGPYVTTGAILVEVADALCRRELREAAVRAIHDLRADADVECVAVEAALFDRGFELYRSRADKDWSLTDCISFVVMRERGIEAALTADAHFVQAGFTALLLGPA